MLILSTRHFILLKLSETILQHFPRLLFSSCVQRRKSEVGHPAGYFVGRVGRFLRLLSRFVASPLNLPAGDQPEPQTTYAWNTLGDSWPGYFETWKEKSRNIELPYALEDARRVQQSCFGCLFPVCQLLLLRSPGCSKLQKTFACLHFCHRRFM